MQTLELLPSLPPIGRSEEFYASKIRHADREHNVHLRESLKVGQYVSLAVGAGLAWSTKQRYFGHAIYHHCQPPFEANEAVVEFYQRLKELVQRHAGDEACRLVSRQDDIFAERIRSGESRAEVRGNAITFFDQIIGDAGRTPAYFHYDDWHAMMVVRNAWI